MMERLKDGTVRYLLSDFDFTEADKAAVERRRYARSANLTEYAPEARALDSDETKFITEQIGTRGELVAARHFKLPFRGERR